MTEAYKVGITIALTNQISRGLMMIQGDLAKTDAAAIKLHKTLGEIKKLGMIGAALGGAGYAGLEAMKSGYEAAKKYEQVVNQFKALKLGDMVNKDADKFARGTQLMGNSATDLMSALRDMHLVVNNYKDAKMLAPFISQMEYANKAVGGDKAGAFNRAQAQALGKVMEWRGGFISDAEMRLQGNMMQKVMSGTSFQVLPRDYRNFLSTGGTAAQQMNNDAFYYKSEPLIQMMSGGAVGTGLMTAYNRLVIGMAAGSPGGKAYIGLLNKLGLIKPGSFSVNKTTGKITDISPDFLKDTNLYKDDPYAWLETKLVPALKHSGYDEKKIETTITQVFGRIGGKVMNQFHQRYIHGKIDSAVAIDKNAMGVDDLVKLAKKSPQGAELALGAAWENLKIAAGESLIPIIIPWLLKFAQTLRDLGAWINHHPVKFDYLIKGFAGLSGAMLIGGSVLALTAALKGLGLLIGIAGGPGSVAGSIGALAGKLNLLGIAAFGVYELINHHQDIANAIDQDHPGIGDKLYNFANGLHDGPLRNFLFGGNAPARSVVPPPSSGQGSVIINNMIDPEKNTQSVVNRMTGKMSGPLSSGNGFDGRLSPIWGGM